MRRSGVLTVLKCYMSKGEAHVWFMPLDKVQECHAALSDAMRQGISHNDLQLVQSYPVRSSLAVHAETWEMRGGDNRSARRQAGGRSAAAKGSSYGEITWVGGSAIHYAPDGGGDAPDAPTPAAIEFAQMSIDDIEKASARKGRIRQKGKAVIAADMAADLAADLAAEQKEPAGNKEAVPLS